MGRSFASGQLPHRQNKCSRSKYKKRARPCRPLLTATCVTLLLHTIRCLRNMVMGHCGNGNLLRRLPQCPSRAQTGCEAPVRRLVFLDTRTASVLAFDRPTKQGKQPCSRFLSLPLDILEHILSYLLIAPAEISLGVVTLEHRLPHHWHPAYYVRQDERIDNRYCINGLGRTPVGLHRRAQAPHSLCSGMLRVNRQLHAVAARMLYGRNAFALDISVPTTYEAAQRHDISRLRLEQIIPLNPAYHKLLRRVNFRHYNNFMHAYPVRFFHSAMLHLLQDMPNAYTAFRRRYNTEYNLFDFETFAGWSPSATPTWLADAAASLATSQPLTPTNTSIPIDQAHRLMSMHWEEPMHSELHVPTTRKRNSLVDLCVMSDAAVSAGPWHAYDPTSWPAARIFIVRLRNDKSEHQWPHERARAWYECKAYSGLQDLIVGKSRGFQRATVHKVERRRFCGPVWRAGPRGTKRRVFTAPMSFFVPSVCRFLRKEQLEREDRRPRRDGGVDEVQVLPVDSEGNEKPWHMRRPVDIWCIQYEYV